MVIGFGNRNIIFDVLGLKSVLKIFVIRYFFKNYNKDYDDDFIEVLVLSLGVMGVIGIEISEIVKLLVEKVKLDRVVVIDVLVLRKMERVNFII